MCWYVVQNHLQKIILIFVIMNSVYWYTVQISVDLVAQKVISTVALAVLLPSLQGRKFMHVTSAFTKSSLGALYKIIFRI